METVLAKEELRYFIKIPGPQCVMVTGMILMLV